MYSDAKTRLAYFCESIPEKKSITKRLTQMLDTIEAARERGATWEQIAEVIGVNRDTLASTISRISRAKRRTATPLPKDAARIKPTQPKPRKGVQSWGAEGS